MRFTFEENILIHNNRTKRVNLRSDPSIHQLLRLQYFFVKIGTYSVKIIGIVNFPNFWLFLELLTSLKFHNEEWKSFWLQKQRKNFFTLTKEMQMNVKQEKFYMQKKSIENFFITIAPATVSSLTKSTHEVFFCLLDDSKELLINFWHIHDEQLSSFISCSSSFSKLEILVFW